MRVHAAARGSGANFARSRTTVRVRATLPQESGEDVYGLSNRARFAAVAAATSEIRTSLPFLGIWFFLLLRGSRATYGGSCGGWDNPALRGGDEVVTVSGVRPNA